MGPTEKTWEYKRPFTRINSPSFNRRGKPDGLASSATREETCRCRTEADGPADGSLRRHITRKLMRTVPSWVPVEGSKEIVEEVEGKLARSFQTWTDFPLFQWHRWYDWNLHVTPDPPYDYLAGTGNTPPTDPQKAAHGLDKNERRVMVGTTIECEWDCGALTGTRLPFGHGQMGPMFTLDWDWPMTNQHVWVAGRWIYDCGHPVDGVSRTELHPCLAVATARWEAEKFEANGDFFVPAIQFLFYTNKTGGWVNFSSIKQNYEFIVDLPKISMDSLVYPIGHTQHVPHNTIVLRPQLLTKFNFDPFIVGGAPVTPAVQPIVVPIRPADPSKPPEQVKITIPLKDIQGDPEAYGVIISLGWHDPDRSQASKVKKCVLTFNRVRKLGVNHDDSPEEWLVKAGVNGRWFSVYKEKVSNNTDIKLGDKQFTFFLSEDDFIYISAHGAEMDLVEDVFVEHPPQRTLAFDNGAAVDFANDIYKGNVRRQQQVAFAIYDRMFFTFNDQNDPLGLVDPEHPVEATDSENPIAVKAQNGKRELVYSAFSAGEIDDTAELKEDTNRKHMDYVLHCTLEVEPQIKTT